MTDPNQTVKEERMTENNEDLVYQRGITARDPKWKFQKQVGRF